MNQAPLRIDPGHRVTMHFSLSLSDGTEVLSTYHESPLEFTLGDGTMVSLLEYALLGLQAGDEQTLEVSGDEAYGAWDEAKQHWLNRSDFAQDMSLQESQVVAFTTAQGEELAGTILELNDDQLLVDFNHPLSGKTFHYRVSIISVEMAE
ncbi:MAG: FKBP-type peptidyl-prolyl cis-trans isomerase [Candidatus Thiodiazotropha sp. (ex Ctena orbiculata)]|nr:FKBP-type peptidyl-prolyl cis-trans isomerase [Candidatus Thiodiazotropha taylori]